MSAMRDFEIWWKSHDENFDRESAAAGWAARANCQELCPECGGTGTVPGEPPSWSNTSGDPPEQCPRGCDIPGEGE